MSQKDRAVIDLILKKNVVGICPKDKMPCKLVKLLFKALGLVWSECRLLEEEVQFLTSDEIGQDYYNKRVKKRGE
jgi:hypothetical protein